MTIDTGGINITSEASRNTEKNPVSLDWFQRFIGGLHVPDTIT